MKRNQFFNILKVHHFKDTIPKFEPCLKKIGDFINPENCAILLSKMVFEYARPKCPDDVVLWGYAQNKYPRRHLKIPRKHSMNDSLVAGYSCYAERTLGSPESKHCKSLEMYSEKIFRRPKHDFVERSTLFRRCFIENRFGQC